jgi:hypothetical protein
MLKFISKIMNGIEALETTFRFLRSVEVGLKAFKAEFEKTDTKKELTKSFEND